jgi:hypothetical protein
MQRKKRQRKKWARAWIQRHRKHGAHHALVKELSDEDSQGFRNFLRMDTMDFLKIMRRLNVPQMFFFLI